MGTRGQSKRGPFPARAFPAPVHVFFAFGPAAGEANAYFPDGRQITVRRRSYRAAIAALLVVCSREAQNHIAVQYRRA